MPAPSTPSAALLRRLAGAAVAGCGEDRDPMGPAASDPAAPESVAAAPGFPPATGALVCRAML